MFNKSDVEWGDSDMGTGGAPVISSAAKGCARAKQVTRMAAPAAAAAAAAQALRVDGADGDRRPRG